MIIDIRVGGEGWAAIARMRGRANRVREALRGAMGRAAIEMASRIAKSELTGPYGGFRAEDTTLATRTGALKRGLTGGIDRGADVAAFVGVLRQSGAAKYAGILETGGEITPQGHPYLAIPIGAAKTRAGIARFTSPRDVRDGFFLRSRSGNLFFARARWKGRGASRRGAIEVLFWLVRKVTIPPKRWLSRGARRHVDEFVKDTEAMFAEGLEKK